MRLAKNLVKIEHSGPQMFSNRSFLVKVVKDEDGVVSAGTSDPIDYSDIAKTITRNTIKVITVYVAADTIRQAIIYTMMTKIK